ncbi:MAG TPA: hypothetical protein VJ826_15985 [Candidatus Polarisedimenticolaceae bacterium]|nr:hypothetical protein [Candidatus Polarisedimenticolaceae bacterium]
MRALVLALAAWLALGAVVADPAAPLTNQEIVQMVAAGTPETEILAAIDARPPAFELDDDMVAELKLAGVGPKILEAMRARQAAAHPAPVVERPRKGMIHVKVELDGASTIKVPPEASMDLAELLHLPAAIADRDVKDLAVYLACTTTFHVPDQWRSKTPLGRDMSATPRHEILAFVAGDTPTGQKPRLDVPKTLEADLDDLEPHDLLLGVAARIGDRWYTLSTGKCDKVKAVKDMPPMVGRISRIGAPFAFKVELSAPQRASDTSLETPASSIVTP